MTSWEEWTYKDAPSEVSGTTVSCAEGVDEWEVRWIVCSKRSPISEPLLRVLRLLPEVRAVVAATSLKKRTIDGMTVVNGVHSSLITSSYECSKTIRLRYTIFAQFHLKFKIYLFTSGSSSRTFAFGLVDLFSYQKAPNKFGWYLSEYKTLSI